MMNPRRHQRALGRGGLLYATPPPKSWAPGLGHEQPAVGTVNITALYTQTRVPKGGPAATVQCTTLLMYCH